MWSRNENDRREEEREKMAKVHEKAQAAIRAKDLSTLISAYSENPSWATIPWQEKERRLQTLPLPEAVRMNWVEGVQALVAMGADPGVSDANRQGMSELGYAPLAEAISRERWAMVDALIELGAPLAEPGQMMWAASFVAARFGPARGVSAWERMEAHGFNFWRDPAAAASSKFLFAGNVKGGTAEERAAWGERLFSGSENADHAILRQNLWHFCFGAAHAGADVSEAMCSRWLDNGRLAGDEQEQAHRVSLLSWGLGNACPVMASCGAAALRGSAGWAWSGGKALTDAAKTSHSEWELVDEQAAFATFVSVWNVLGEEWAKSPRLINEAAASAATMGNGGLLAALLIHGGADEAVVVEAWRKQVNERFCNQRETSLALTALMAKALNDGHKEAGVARVEAYNRSQRGSNQIDVGNCVAEAEKWIISSTAPVVAEKRRSMRV